MGEERNGHKNSLRAGDSRCVNHSWVVVVVVGFFFFFPERIPEVFLALRMRVELRLLS